MYNLQNELKGYVYLANGLDNALRAEDSSFEATRVTLLCIFL